MATIQRQTASTGMMSKRWALVLGREPKAWPQNQMMGAEVLRPSFQPGKGKVWAHSTTLGRTMASSMSLRAPSRCSASPLVKV